MRAREFLKLIEAAKKAAAVPGDPNSDPLYSLKSTIAHKIKELEPDEQTQHALDEINDVLSTVNLGGRRKATLAGFDEKDIEGKLTWADSDVQAAKELLAKYIVSLDAPVAYKKSMLEQWKNGGLIDVDLLLSGTHTIDKIVKGYGTNPAVKELSNDLMQVASLGKGKGEFMLKVLSPRIKNPASGKGDIEITEFGTVEVKTTDGGAGRFYDRQVKPGPGYQAAVNDFVNTFSQYDPTPDQEEEPAQATAPTQPVEPNQAVAPAVPNQAVAPAAPGAVTANTQNTAVPTVEAKSKVAKTKKVKKLMSGAGINIDSLVKLYQLTPPDARTDFATKLGKALEQVFLKAPEYGGAVVEAITSGNAKNAKQLYGVGILNNYMEFKTDEGILYIDLTASVPTFTYFTDNASLNAGGLRLQIDTAYPIANDPQYAYPQTSIVKTAREQPAAPQAIEQPAV